MGRIRIGSRDSKLAIIQAEIVIKAIKEYDPRIETELITMKTKGDKILDVSLDKIGGKGLFVKELEDALLNKDVDIIVHSLKDMPMEVKDQLPIVALSEREDPRDVLIYPKGGKYPDKPIGCSSKRRTIQLKELGFHNIAPLRGNVITRLEKLDRGEYSAIVLAAAGIHRLGLQDRISRYFQVDEIMPAACQGILGVQGRWGEDFSYLSKLHKLESKIVSLGERAFVRELDEGCSSPTAAYGIIKNNLFILEGMYVEERTGRIYKGVKEGPISEAEEIGRDLALDLKRRVE